MRGKKSALNNQERWCCIGYSEKRTNYARFVVMKTRTMCVCTEGEIFSSLSLVILVPDSQNKRKTRRSKMNYREHFQCGEQLANFLQENFSLRESENPVEGSRVLKPYLQGSIYFIVRLSTNTGLQGKIKQFLTYLLGGRILLI